MKLRLTILAAAAAMMLGAACYTLPTWANRPPRDTPPSNTNTTNTIDEVRP